jgi:hypothetical protein
MSSGGEMRSRREVLRGALKLAVLACGTAACGKVAAPTACVDVTGLAPNDVQMRAALGYVEPGPDKNKNCASCQQFVMSADEAACSACKLLKGPIHPSGTCKAFAPKSA